MPSLPGCCPTATALPPLKTSDTKIFRCIWLNIFVFRDFRGSRDHLIHIPLWQATVATCLEISTTYFRDDSLYWWQKFPNMQRQGAIVFAGKLSDSELHKKKNWDEGIEQRRRGGSSRGVKWMYCLYGRICITSTHLLLASQTTSQTVKTNPN